MQKQAEKKIKATLISRKSSIEAIPVWVIAYFN